VESRSRFEYDEGAAQFLGARSHWKTKKTNESVRLKVSDVPGSPLSTSVHVKVTTTTRPL
jgi:hypothetical protein